MADVNSLKHTASLASRSKVWNPINESTASIVARSKYEMPSTDLNAHNRFAMILVSHMERKFHMTEGQIKSMEFDSGHV